MFQNPNWRSPRLLDPKLAAEVGFDHFTTGRFPYGTKFIRWRPEKAPAQCTMQGVKRESQSALIFL